MVVYSYANRENRRCNNGTQSISRHIARHKKASLRMIDRPYTYLAETQQSVPSAEAHQH